MYDLIDYTLDVIQVYLCHIQVSIVVVTLGHYTP